MSYQRTQSGSRLTQIRLHILRAIADSLDNRGFAPSIRELGDIVNRASSSTIFCHLDSLVRNGYLTAQVGKPRARAITQKGRTALHDAGLAPGTCCPTCHGTGRVQP